MHVTLLGGGFGRKSKPDFAIEAAVLSKAVDGKPVKVTWTRDDDLHNSYYHTVSVEHLEAHAFAVQSFVAELAAAAKRDPKDFLLEVIGPPRQVSPETLGDTWNHGESPERYPVDTGRLRRVVEVAAREAGWGVTRRLR